MTKVSIDKICRFLNRKFSQEPFEAEINMTWSEKRSKAVQFSYILAGQPPPDFNLLFALKCNKAAWRNILMAAAVWGNAWAGLPSDRVALRLAAPHGPRARQSQGSTKYFLSASGHFLNRNCPWKCVNLIIGWLATKHHKSVVLALHQCKSGYLSLKDII